MKLGLTILVTLLWVFNSFSQTRLNKTEILNEFKKGRTIPSLDSVFYNGYHSDARAVLDKLLAAKIDTLVVYSFDNPGHVFLSSNDTCTHIQNSYFFWKEQGEYFFKAANYRCISIDKISCSRILNFTTDNFSKIKDEFFMEAVMSAERKGDKMKFSESWINHEGKYSMLILVGKQFNYLEFSDNGLTNKESLFLDYNKTLTSFNLFEMIKEAVKTK